MKKIFLFILLFISHLTFAQLKVARLFSDHVVLQRQKPIPVWGWSTVKDKITVTLAGQTQIAVTDANGKWTLTFSPLEAGGPYEMFISNKSNSLKIKDILIGEVWLCSGQSNMELSVKQADNYLKEKKNANFPQIRHFSVEHEVTMTPETDLKSGEWKLASEETVGDFTAVGFFFAREIYQKLNIPVGLLHSSWGGSQVEGWVSKEGMATNDEFKNYAQNLPNNWTDADVMQDKKLRKQLFKTDFMPTLEDEKKYTSTDYDFSKWQNAGNSFGSWDWKGVWAFRGNGFMARNVEISAGMAGKETTLGLGIQDSPNNVYINGKLVSEGIIKGIRKITVPANTWKVGNNSLVIKFGKMIDPAWYGLGLMGTNDDLFVSAIDEKVSLDNDWKLMPSFADKHEYNHSSNNVGTTIYNGMIAPLVPFAIRGTLWYQGETNAGRAYQYRQSFPLMINDWRKKWNDDFSFYFVQLSTYGSYQNSNQGSNWAELREAQTMTLSLPKTGMAVTTDVGNPVDIHPTNKQDVGHRLALNALKKDYGQNIVFSSPMYDNVAFGTNNATISFKNVGGGLMVKDKFGYLKGFEVAGEDKVFHYAKAEIVGDRVVVIHPQNQKPIAVRYAWADSPIDANLFNVEGLPANSFRTDDWEGITRKVKFE